MRRPATWEGVLAAVLASVLVVVAGALTTRGDDADSRPSSSANGPDGLRALFLVLERSGVPVDRVRGPGLADVPRDVTLVVADAVWPVTRSEADGLLAWTRSGGRLVVLGPVGKAGRGGHDALLGRLGRTIASASAARGIDVAADDPGRLADPDGSGERPSLPVRARFRVAEGDADTGGTPAAVPRDAWKPVLVARSGSPGSSDADAPEPIAVEAPLGAGTVCVVADAGFLGNRELRVGDAAQVAVRLLVPAGRTGVRFDEYHQGLGDADPRGGLGDRLLALLTHTWPGRALLVLVGAAVLHGIGAAVRLGAPLPEPRTPRRAMREHAEALGAVLHRARAGADALSLLAEGVRRSCAPRVGLPVHVSWEELVAHLRSSAADGAPELADALREALDASAGRVPARLHPIAARLTAARGRFLHG